ncbi:MAG: N,N-dimethylformamidase beta subunit family domain-containing protein [Nitrososphaeraceae archaeon]
MTNREKMNKSKALPLVTIISMIIAALVLSASGDITSSSSINNGGRVLSLHTAALAKVDAIKTQSNSFKDLQIAPRFVKRNNETSQELLGTQTRHARYSTLPTRKVDEESSFNSSLVNASMPLSSSLLTLMKIGFNSSNYNNHGGNFSTNNNTSSSSSSSTQPSNRIVRREIMSQTQLADETTQKQRGVSSEEGPRIALIKPSFTAAAYANGFYKFYKLYNSTPVGKNVTTDLNLLSVPVNASWYQSLPYVFSMLKLLNDIKSVTPDSNITIYDDAAADNGFMFTKNGSNAFDLVILGHQEYVTQKEYDNLKRFVANGGTMLILDGNVFYAEVKYDHQKDMVSLVKGHYWAFNGRTAWKSVAERWKNETSQWVGSNYLCYKCVKSFQNNPFGYKPHEEQYLDNPHDVVLFNYNASIPRTYFPVLSSSASLGQVSTKPIIATYELDYKRGRVITLGIYSDDIVTNNKFDSYFEKLLLKQGITDITD